MNRSRFAFNISGFGDGHLHSKSQFVLSGSGKNIGVADLFKFFLINGGNGFNRLFSNDIEPIRQLRGIGLSIVDSIPPARRFFMRQAGGETGDPPRLLKGQRLDAA